MLWSAGFVMFNCIQDSSQNPADPINMICSLLIQDLIDDRKVTLPSSLFNYISKEVMRLGELAWDLPYLAEPKVLKLVEEHFSTRYRIENNP